jgi:molybdopterin molybdotransferase/putative molybdopterin biosynthesis protein
MYKKPDFEPNRNEMLEILQSNIQPISRVETISLTTAAGRVCAETICAKNDLPNKPVSGCDGIAVRFADFIKGMPNTYSWTEGKEYCFSNTGVAIAETFDTVIPIEKVELDKEGKIRLLVVPSRCGEYVGAVGSHLKKGEVLIYKGEIITPALMGILLSDGFMNIRVLAKPKVVFIPTGDELVPAGFETPCEKNVESNSLMLKAYIEEYGAEAIIYPIIPDEFKKLQEAIFSAVQIADLVLICAGSSKGSKDFTIDLLESLGKLTVYELGHGPGKHCSLTYFENIPIIGLPGPPNGADLVTTLYVKNTLSLMQMQPVQLPYTLEAIFTNDTNMYGLDFIDYAYVFIKKGQYYVRPVAMQGKTRAELYHAHNARFYIKKQTAFKAGDVINVEMRLPKEYITEEE